MFTLNIHRPYALYHTSKISTNNVDADQMPNLQHLIWVYRVCSGLCVWILREKCNFIKLNPLTKILKPLLNNLGSSLKQLPNIANCTDIEWIKVNVPKISNKVSDKMTYANSADPDQTAPEGAVWSGSTLFAIPLSILRNSCIKSKI